MRKKIATIIFFAVCCAAFSVQASAKEFESRQSGLDVMFAIDSSGSMVSNDPGRMGMSMVKAFVDTVHIEDIRIGFVSYSDAIGQTVSPVSIADPAARETLKARLDAVSYSGDTDMGLGVETALSAMHGEGGRKRVLVVISDGETDLPGRTDRTETESEADLARCGEICAEENIPIYGVAFGQYEGSGDSLADLAALTGGETYKVTQPGDLIEILYGIFDNNISYKIQQLSSGIYGQGNQEIRVALEEPYLDEMDLLLISSGPVGDTVIRYGEQEIPLAMSANYGVGKIGYESIDEDIKEMTLTTATAQGQSVKLYLISYRELLPVLSVEEDLQKNGSTEYQVYFKDRQGQVIADDDFYSRFSWEWAAPGGAGSPGNEGIALGGATVKDGVLAGEVKALRSGSYELAGVLSDQLGAYPFDARVRSVNTPPSGSLPELSLPRLGGSVTYTLDGYFQDGDGDSLTYSIEAGEEGRAGAGLAGNVLELTPLRSGRQTFTLFVSDGEDTFTYPMEVSVTPIWVTYWWVILLAAAGAGVGLFKILYKPKPQLEVIAQRKQGNRFAGKMDAYVTVQPPGSGEIPPLTFPMYKIRDSRVCLGDLMREYPELSEALRLDLIFLIADEGRRMILYHTSPATLMTGSSILCRQIQYSLGFGDVLYITAPDGAYELELHYIAVIQ